MTPTKELIPGKLYRTNQALGYSPGAHTGSVIMYVECKSRFGVGSKMRDFYFINESGDLVFYTAGVNSHHPWLERVL